MKDVLKYYNISNEGERLLKSEGIIEFDRSKEIIKRYLSRQCLSICDIGGGSGMYSRWLASLGHNVSLIDFSESLINEAKKIEQLNPQLNRIIVSDARNIPLEDNLFDIVLLMGPLYHLQSSADRTTAIKEAYRLLKKGGVILITAISRYGSLNKSIKHHIHKYYNLEDNDFQNMIINEIRNGTHLKSEKFPNLLPSAYFHSPEELKVEMENVGLVKIKMTAIEGPFWYNNLITEGWAQQKSLLSPLLTSLEEDLGIINMSLHFFGIGNKTC